MGGARPYGLGVSEVEVDAPASASAALWCFLCFFSGLVEVVSVALALGSEAVAEVGAPLAAAESAWGVAAAVESVVVEDAADGSVIDEDGALWVVWALGSAAGEVCWARADPA